MLGLPALVHDIGSLSTFGDEIRNKFKYHCDMVSYRATLDALIRHLGQPNRRYDVAEYHPQRYAQRLATVLRLKRSNEQPETTHTGSLVAADGDAFPVV